MAFGSEQTYKWLFLFQTKRSTKSWTNLLHQLFDVSAVSILEDLLCLSRNWGIISIGHHDHYWLIHHFSNNMQSSLTGPADDDPPNRPAYKQLRHWKLARGYLVVQLKTVGRYDFALITIHEIFPEFALHVSFILEEF